MPLPVDFAIKIVALFSICVEYTSEKGAKCPLCGQPNAHVKNLKDEITRYHRCQACGLTFRSRCEAPVYYKKSCTKGRKKKKIPQNGEISCLTELTLADFSSIFDIEVKSNGDNHGTDNIPGGIKSR